MKIVMFQSFFHVYQAGQTKKHHVSFIATSGYIWVIETAICPPKRIGTLDGIHPGLPHKFSCARTEKNIGAEPGGAAVGFFPSMLMNGDDVC